jgi:hypothetical protein
MPADSNLECATWADAASENVATQTWPTHSIALDRAGAGPSVRSWSHFGQVSRWSWYSLRNPYRKRSGQASFEQYFMWLCLTKTGDRDAYHCPPSMRNTSPVIHAASSEAR